MMKTSDSAKRPQRPHVGELTAPQEEALRILQEECSEVIKACSKVYRAGPDFIVSGESMRSNLETEIGDVFALVDELIKHGLVNCNAIARHRMRKRVKLWAWTDHLGVGSMADLIEAKGE